jgi:hypothetical protein
MIINSLDKMESIVKESKYLSWDGWTVISSYPSKKGSTSKYGAYVGGEWHLQRRFEVAKSGWDIPERFLEG